MNGFQFLQWIFESFWRWLGLFMIVVCSAAVIADGLRRKSP